MHGALLRPPFGSGEGNEPSSAVSERQVEKAHLQSLTAGTCLMMFHTGQQGAGITWNYYNLCAGMAPKEQSSPLLNGDHAFADSTAL